MTSIDSERRTLSVPDAGRQLGLGRNASYEAAARGDIPTIRIGKRLLVPIPLFERLLRGELQSGGKAA